MRLLLNIYKSNNSCFIDAETGFFLDRIHKMKNVNKITPAIERAIRADNIIDVDQETGIPPKDAKYVQMLLDRLNITKKDKLSSKEQKEIDDKKIIIDADVKEEIIDANTKEKLANKTKKTTRKRTTKKEEK